MVAPVREICAQVLGTVLKYMTSNNVQKVLQALLLLRNHTQWEVRHAALLGIKYLVAVRIDDMAAVLLPLVLDPIISGLMDTGNVVSCCGSFLCMFYR